MPPVTYKTGFLGQDGHEEELTEYLCDWPGCPNVAEHVAACVRDIGLCIALCQEHAMRSD